MKNAIFFDIDGTLIDTFGGNKEITPTVEHAIRFLQERGDYVFIATGRPYAFLSKTILEFGFDGFVLANGAHVIVHKDTIFKEPMNPESVKYMVGVFEQQNIQYILEGDYQSYMKDKFKEFYSFYEGIGVSKDLLVSEYEEDFVAVYKIEMLCPNEEAEKVCLSLIMNNPECDYYHSISHKAFEVYAKKNSKATGIQKVLNHLGIPIEHSYAFGDGKNDIEMLATVGCGIAMGNASDDVKCYANEVTDTVQNDGVAVGIQRYVLDKE